MPGLLAGANRLINLSGARGRTSRREQVSADFDRKAAGRTSTKTTSTGKTAKTKRSSGGSSVASILSGSAAKRRLKDAGL